MYRKRSISSTHIDARFWNGLEISNTRRRNTWQVSRSCLTYNISKPLPQLIPDNCAFLCSNYAKLRRSMEYLVLILLFCLLLEVATSQQSYYARLGVKPKATEKEIKKAYRKLAMKVCL